MDYNRNDEYKIARTNIIQESKQDKRRFMMQKFTARGMLAVCLCFIN